MNLYKKLYSFYKIWATLYLNNICLFPGNNKTRKDGNKRMARFPEAEERLLNKKICMHCGASNAPKAIRCRRCRSRELRVKAKEGRGV